MKGPTELKWDQVSVSPFLGTPKSGSLGLHSGAPQSTEARSQGLGLVDPADPEPRASPLSSSGYLTCVRFPALLREHWWAGPPRCLSLCASTTNPVGPRRGPAPQLGPSPCQPITLSPVLLSPQPLRPPASTVSALTVRLSASCVRCPPATSGVLRGPGPE